MKSELELQKEFVDKPELKEQIEYLKSGALKGLNGVVLMDAFLKGIRDLGYKSTPYALNELNDNSIQAGAKNIHYELIGLKNKVKEILLLDDGHGMVKDMLQIAVTWGGTHRQGSKKGFGKYGYGLPSAALSICKKYTVYSKIEGGDWHKITFDITRLDDDNNPITTDPKDVMQGPEKCSLPKFIADFEGKNYSVKNLKQGTIIHFQEIDRAKPIAINSLQDSLVYDFSQTYFKLLENTNIFVNNNKVEPVDVLFATPGLKGFEDPMNNLTVPIEKKEYYDEKVLEVKTDDGETHEINIRWSRLPALFAVDNGVIDPKTKKFVPSGFDNIEEAYIKNKTTKTSSSKSFRFKVMKDNHGIVFRRLGRRMDVVKALKGYYNIQNNSRYFKCEVNFPPALDEYFSVNTSKQQIIPDEKILETLKLGGIFGYLKEIEKEYAKEGSMLKTQLSKERDNDPDLSKVSEELAEEAKVLLGEQTATEDHVERKEKRDQRKEQKIEELAKKEKISVEEATKQYENLYKDRPFSFGELEMGKGNTFIKLEEHGDTIEVTLNKDHDFYKAFYMGPGSNDESRTSWQTFFLMYAQLSFTFSADHKDFLHSFTNKLSDHLKVAGRKRYDREEELGTTSEDDDFKDLDINFDLDKLVGDTSIKD